MSLETKPVLVTAGFTTGAILAVDGGTLTG